MLHPTRIFWGTFWKVSQNYTSRSEKEEHLSILLAGLMDDSEWGHWHLCQAFDIPISCRMLLIYTFGGIAGAVINSLLPAPLSGGWRCSCCVGSNIYISFLRRQHCAEVPALDPNLGRTGKRSSRHWCHSMDVKNSEHCERGAYILKGDIVN